MLDTNIGHKNHNMSFSVGEERTTLLSVFSQCEKLSKLKLTAVSIWRFMLAVHVSREKELN